MAVTVQARDLRETAAPAARRRWLLGAIFAGLLCLGLIQTAVLVADDEATPILRMEGRHLVAAGTLAFRLREQVAPAGRTGPVVGPRFRDAAGAECRRFAGRPSVEGPVAGVACQIEGDWRVVELSQDNASRPLS